MAGEPESKVCHRCGYVPATEDETTCPQDDSYLVPQADHDEAPDDALLGRVIAGKYAIIGLIGAGGMGAVYRAIQQPVGRQVALKVIRNTGGQAAIVEKRFEQEAAVVAQLEHANTVTLYDFGVDEDGTLYMAMELVRGRPLSSVLAQKGSFEPDRAAWVACGILDALSEAHHRGLIHRDIKPANVMLVEAGWGPEGLKVLDFGLTKVLGGEEEPAQRLTRTGAVFGTPHYMAPEQAAARPVGPQADLYSVGVMLYELLTGDVPFPGDSTLEVLMAHQQDEPPPLPSRLNVPPALASVLERALAKDPKDRFGSTGEMAAAIREAVGETRQPTAPSRDITADETLPADSDRLVRAAWLGETFAGPGGLGASAPGTTPARKGGTTSAEMAAEVVSPPEAHTAPAWAWAFAAFGTLVAVAGVTFLLASRRASQPVEAARPAATSPAPEAAARAPRDPAARASSPAGPETSPAPASRQGDADTVLVIESYHAGYGWDAAYRKAIEAALGGDHSVVFFQMDTKRLPTEVHAQRAQLAWKRYRELSPALVMLGDDNALKYLGPRFAGEEVPVVFLGINGTPEHYLPAGARNFTGVLERPPISEAVGAIGRVLPAVPRKVLVLFDAGTTSRAAVSETFGGQTRLRLSGVTADLKLISSWEVWRQTVLEARHDGYGAILLGTYQLVSDADAVQVPPDDVVRWVSASTPLPLFAIWGFAVGHDKALGGLVLSGRSLGEQAARIASRVLGGARPEDLPPEASEGGRYVFSKAQLARHRITLPEGIAAEATLVE